MDKLDGGFLISSRKSKLIKRDYFVKIKISE